MKKVITTLVLLLSFIISQKILLADVLVSNNGNIYVGKITSNDSNGYLIDCKLVLQ